MVGKKTYYLNCGGRIINTEMPLVMGILNVTPDSFFDGGRYNSSDSIKQRAEQIISEGAEIIDIGAYSTRPGADDVSPDEEWRRLDFALEIVRKSVPDAIISIDTFRGDVARKCVKEGGAHIINDISAYTLDPDMLDAISELNVPYVLMHIKGTPKDMQVNPKYANRLTQEVIGFLSKKVNELSSRGVADIIIDPGFGFGKTIDDNFQLMADLRQFDTFDRPVLVGISRKSMIYKTIGGTPESSLNGTSVLNTMALLAGADILRVHDVKETVECIKLVDALRRNS